VFLVELRGVEPLTS